MKRIHLISGVLLLAASAQATLLASESFEYDTTLGGVYLSNTVYQSGTGWAAGGSYPNWKATNMDGLRLDSDNGGQGSSLGYTNSVGNRCLSAGPGANARSLATGFALNSDYYTAFLARTDSAADAFRIEFSYTTPGLAVRWKPFELNSDGTIETQAGTVNASTVSPMWSPNTTYLVVSKWEASGDHSYTKIFDIGMGTGYLTEPMDWAAEADVHADGLSGATILDIYMTASTAGVEIDEFRIGTTYADVVQDYTGEAPPPPFIVFAHEDFDYLPGSVLSAGTQDGGNGWAAGWQDSSGGGLTLRSVDESLWFGNSQAFSEDGSCMVESAGGTSSDRELNLSIPLDGTNLYFAALVRKQGAPTARFVFYDGASVAANVGFADYDGDGDNPDLFISPSEDLYPAAAQYAADALGTDTYLLILKRTGSGISASVISGDGTTPVEPETWDVTDAGTTSASVDTLRIAIASGTLLVDEIGIGSTFDAAVANLPTELPPPPAPPVQETIGYVVDQPLTTQSKSWTYAVKEAGDYQLGIAWVEVESGNDVVVEVFTNGTHRVKALYAPAGEVTRIDTRIENLAADDTIKVRVSPNGGTYRAGYQIAFSTPTFNGLPVFDVATYGAVGDGTTDDFYAIQAAVSAAKTAGGGIVQFDGSKTYRTMGLSDLTIETLIDLEEAENIKVEGNGALIVMHPPDRFAYIRHAENIQVDGFTIDYDPIPYYQGTITDINVANMTIDIDVPERYPLPDVGTDTNPTPFFGRYFVPDSPGARSGSGENIYVESTALNGGPRKVRIQVPDEVGGVSMVPRVQNAYNNGATEFVVPHLTYGHRNGSTQIYGSSRVKMSNLQYYNMAHFWMTITQNDGPVTLSNVDLEVTDPVTELLASWRDGMHIKNGRWGILIEDGDWDGASMYDDTFAIYSRRQEVLSTDGNKATLKPAVFNRETWLWQPGDWASFWSPNQETLRGMARVVGVRDLEAPNYEVTFESIPLGVSSNDVVLHEESLNRGTLIRNCRTTSVGTEDSSTRLRGTDMRFENNHFEDFGFRLEWSDDLGTPRARDVVVENTYMSSTEEWIMQRPLGVLFKNCVIDGLMAGIHFGADDVLFDGVAWSNMTGNIMSVNGGSHAWIFGGSSRNGSTSGLSSYVSKDGSSTVTYSAPANYPPAEPPSGGDSTPPVSPILLAAASEGTVVLDWTDSSGAAAYAVYRRTSTDGPYARLVNTITSSHIDTSAVVGQTNYYVVTATDVNGNESKFSNEVSAVPEGIILSPAADAYVHSGSYQNSNFGSSTLLRCKTDPAGNYTRESYLRFDLSSLPGLIARAVLRLNVVEATDLGDTHTAHFVGNDSWGEFTITWNNKPAAGTELDAAPAPAVGEWLELDLTGQAAIEWAGDQSLSTVLISSGDDLVDYSSKQGSVGNRPELAVATMAVLPPDPPTGLTVTAAAGSRELSLNWADQSGSGVSRYGVYRSTTPGGPYTHWINTSANAYVDADVELFKTYYYVVTAINADGYASGFSSEASDAPAALVLQPIADAYVQGGSFANDNYGTNTVLECKTDIDNSSYNREPYLRFDLSSLGGPVVSATLRLKVESIIGSGPNTHTVHFVSDDNWGETTLTWNTKPAAGTALDAAMVPAAGSWIELDVTGQVAGEQAGDQLFSAVLISDGTVLAGYHSREAPADAPQLVIETGPSGYSLWADDYMLIYGPEGHDDTDGMNNFLEYALGGNPTNNDAVFVLPHYGLVHADGSNWFYHVYNERTDDDLLSYTVSRTTNLVSGTWQTNGVEPVGESIAVDDFKSVTNRVSTEGFNEQFLRLQVEEK